MNKNNKGFTLIELLAIISILAIILLIAVPSINNVMEKAKKNAFRDSILLIEKQSGNEIILNIINNTYVTPDVGYYSGFNIQEANMKNSKDKYKGYFLYVNEYGSKKKMSTFIFISDGEQMVCGVNLKDFTVDDIVKGKECPYYIGETLIIKDEILTYGDIGDTYALMNYYGDETINDESIDPVITLSTEYPNLVNSPSTVTVTIDYHDAVIKQYKVGTDEIKNYTGPFEVSANSTVYAQGTKGDLVSEIAKKEIANIVPEGLIAVQTPEGLNNIRNNLDASYVIVNDIDMSGYNFTPISGFNGKIYGYNKTISNLTINTPDSDKVSFITDPKKDVEIRNLTFKDLNLTGNDYVGIIGNTDEKITVSNVHLDGGTIKGNNFIGGIVGNGKINGVYLSSKGNIEGYNYVGGIAGRLYSSSTLNKSYNDSLVTSTGYYTGGLIGQQVMSSIKEVYNLGDINAANSNLTGGITGQLYGGSISDAYNAGKYLNDSSTTLNPFAGSVFLGILSKSSMYNITALNNISNTNFNNITTTDNATKKETYTNLNFDTTFSISEGQSLPYITGLKNIDNHIIQ